MPANTLSSVDLPVPLPPTRPVRSSGVISQFASSKSSLGPNRLPAAESCSINLYFLIYRIPNVIRAHASNMSSSIKRPNGPKQQQLSHTCSIIPPAISMARYPHLHHQRSV